MTKIKICGITNLSDALYAVELGVDALGFIFSNSPRKVAPSQAKEIITQLPPFVSPVGVFVNEALSFVAEIAQFCRLYVIQLHGDENPEYCLSLFPFKIIKAFRIRVEDDLKKLVEYKEVANCFLLDSLGCGAIYGGTGISFDWKLAKKAKEMVNKRIILAGGLNPENVKEAIQICQPYAVDVCSGVEEKPGKKDFVKLKKFVEAVRNTI